MRLNGVEEGEVLAVQRLVGRVSQGRHGEGLQIQELRGRRVALGQDQVTEGHWQLRLGSCPCTIIHRITTRRVRSFCLALTYFDHFETCQPTKSILSDQSHVTQCAKMCQHHGNYLPFYASHAKKKKINSATCSMQQGLVLTNYVSF